VFERFTERARQVVVFAQDEARALWHNHIGTEHLLLGLLREEQGVAAAVLASLGVGIEETRAKVAEIVGMGESVTGGQIPFTPRAKKVLELSLREAMSHGHSYIATEHILLGLVSQNDAVAARVPLDLGADAPTVRTATTRLVSRPGRRQEAFSPRPGVSRMSGTVELRRAGWEYRIEVWTAAVADRREWLSLLGDEGWQLVGVAPGDGAPEWVFQRPKRDGQSDRPRWTTALLGRHAADERTILPLTVRRLAQTLANRQPSASAESEPGHAGRARDLNEQLGETYRRITTEDRDPAAATIRVDELVAAARTSRAAAVEEGRLERAVELRDCEHRLIKLLDDVGELLADGEGKPAAG
jgi:hypothetical protein